MLIRALVVVVLLMSVVWAGDTASLSVQSVPDNGTANATVRTSPWASYAVSQSNLNQARSLELWSSSSAQRKRRVLPRPRFRVGVVADDTTDYSRCTNGSTTCTLGTCTSHNDCTQGLYCTSDVGDCTELDGCTEGPHCTDQQGGGQEGCTQGFQCTTGTCTSGDDCTDGDACTSDQWCTGGDNCTQGGNGCTAGSNCTNGNNCTQGDGCTGGGGCTGGAGCTSGDMCTGGINCTNGSSCSGGAQCTNGGSCTSGMSCSVGFGCARTPDPGVREESVLLRNVLGSPGARTWDDHPHLRTEQPPALAWLGWLSLALLLPLGAGLGRRRRT